MLGWVLFPEKTFWDILKLWWSIVFFPFFRDRVRRMSGVAPLVENSISPPLLDDSSAASITFFLFESCLADHPPFFLFGDFSPPGFPPQSGPPFSPSFSFFVCRLLRFPFCFELLPAPSFSAAGVGIFLFSFPRCFFSPSSLFFFFFLFFSLHFGFSPPFP